MKDIRVPTKKVGNRYVGILFWWCTWYNLYQVHLVIHRSRRVVNDALLEKKRINPLVDYKSTGDGSLRGLIYAFKQMKEFSKDHPVLIYGDDLQRRTVYNYRLQKDGWHILNIDGDDVTISPQVDINSLVRLISSKNTLRDGDHA